MSTTSTSPPIRPPLDGLYSERLEAFMHRTLMDIQAFSEREGRDVEETRRYVAEWHCRYLFENQVTRPVNVENIADHDSAPVYAYAILHNTSQALESLHATSGVQSFLVAVDPTHGPSNILPSAGFLGGTVVGREFWRGMRGGGEAGATAFRAYCAKAPSKTAQSVVSDGPTPGTAQGSSAPNAGALKTELYAAIRTALRTASGHRSAEMKWSNHARLSTYGVRLVGWPQDVPQKNPSTLSIAQNRRLLQAVQCGALRFVRLEDRREGLNRQGPTAREESAGGEDDTFIWVHEDIGT